MYCLLTEGIPNYLLKLFLNCYMEGDYNKKNIEFSLSGLVFNDSGQYYYG